MALQNRVHPDGRIVATPARGTMMGNRGGQIHKADQTLTRRRWASRAWIICLLHYRDWHREVMQPRGYTELFFLDEATAIAAGHRPCYLCRNADAKRFAAAWADGHGAHSAPRAGEMDTVLHRERVARMNGEQLPSLAAADLADGVMVHVDGTPFLFCEGALHAWSFEGYGPPCPLPDGPLETITPPSAVMAIAAGYRPGLHVSCRSGSRENR